ncbi:aspartyl-phosphate phosphatase Spo0E family protein [Priestia aryabhattai]
MELKRHEKRKLLFKKIEDSRALMIQTALREGFTSLNVLKMSQDLDLLLNEFRNN